MRLSKRSLILGAGATFIMRPARALVSLRPNPLAYPGIAAGINPAHPATTSRLRYAGVARSGSFLNLLSPKLPTLGNSPTAQMTWQGPAINFSGATAYVEAIGAIVAEHPTAITHAAILTPLGTAQSLGVVDMTGNFNNPDTGIVINAGTFQLWTGGNTSSLTAFPNIVANTPYFVAISLYNSVSSGNPFLAGVMVNLLNGKTYFSVANGVDTIGNIAAANYFIGGWSSSGFSSNSLIHATMFSVDALSGDTLLAWAKAPWDLWYPPIMSQLMASELANNPTVPASHPGFLLLGK